MAASNPKSSAHLGFSLLCFFSLLTLALSSTYLSDDPTHQILQQFGLPIGLLPDNIKSVWRSDDNGDFVVELDKPCYVHFDYLVYYEKKITGKLNYGSITHLDGIEVKKLFMWLDVDEIKVDLPPSDSIYFQVGIINKKLDVSQFQTVHSCGDKITSMSDQSRNTQVRILVDEMEMLVTE